MTLEEYHRQNIQMTPDEFNKFVNGQSCGTVYIIHKQYMVCARCNSVVRINKPIIGSLHICTPVRSEPD